MFTNHFFPEDFKANDVAFEMQKRGFEVTVITAVPDYPKGKFFDGYGIFRKSREDVNGVHVIRLPIIPRGRGGAVRMVLNYASYYFCAAAFTFFHKFFCKYDAVFVHLTSPFFVGKCAVALKRWQKIPLVFWVLDLWPESLTAAVGIQSPLVIGSQNRMVRRVYENCDRILIGSKGFERSILEKGDFKDRLVYFPNWAETVREDESFDITQVAPFDRISKDDFVLLFAGNIGEAQNLDAVLEAAVALKEEKRVKFVFVGDGRRREALAQLAVDNGLGETVFFTGRYPIDTMPVFMKKADALMFSLKDEICFNLTVPQKVQFYMSQGKPVIAMINGEGADLVREAQCGVAVPAGDSDTLSEAVRRMATMPKDELNLLGENGRKFYENNFTKEMRMEQLEKIVNEAIVYSIGGVI